MASITGRQRRRGFAAWAFSCATALVSTASAQDAGSTNPIVVTPLTNAASTPPDGYFEDPYPIKIPGPVWHQQSRVFSGTTPSFLVCPGSLQATCQEHGQITLDPGPLAEEAKRHGATLGAVENYNIFVGEDHTLQMAATYFVSKPDLPKGESPWTVIVHAHPEDANDPWHWCADTVLVGSLKEPALANYDGKYFQDNGTLYLIYDKNILISPQRSGLVAQRMLSPSKAASDAPVLLLEPKPGIGFASERYYENEQPDGFKLIETGNITKIDGKYALAYSVGAYNKPDYKSGVAWSDTFLPRSGKTYRKVLRPDPNGVWDSPGGVEVQYLLQSEKPDWPNDVASQVLAPGVPSILRAQDGSWHLVFAGYAPGDAPLLPNTKKFNPAYRRPYSVRLRVSIPDSATVQGATDAALAQWITPYSGG